MQIPENQISLKSVQGAKVEFAPPPKMTQIT